MTEISNDALKQEVAAKARVYEDELKSQIEDIKENTIEIFKALAITGLAAYGTHFILKKVFGINLNLHAILGNEEKDEKISDQETLPVTHQDSGVMSTIKKELAIFVIELAKKKLLALLQDLEKKEVSEAQEKK